MIVIPDCYSPMSMIMASETGNYQYLYNKCMYDMWLNILGAIMIFIGLFSGNKKEDDYGDILDEVLYDNND